MNLSDLDYTDSKGLFAFSRKTVELSQEYKRSRSEASAAQRYLNICLAKAYTEGTVDKGISRDKAILSLLKHEECRDKYSYMMDQEANYKGLEEELKARHNLMSLAQTLSRLGGTDAKA